MTTVREYLTDGSILRHLRELRSDFEINYEYMPADYLYKKIRTEK